MKSLLTAARRQRLVSVVLGALYAATTRTIVADAFFVHYPSTTGYRMPLSTTTTRLFSSEQGTTATASAVDESDDNNPLGLTPELLKITNAFERIGDDKLRYKQLLFMANQLDPMDPTKMIPENQVPGCLSTVHIDGTAEKNNADEYLIHFVGDSDGLLTKGLVSLLIRGLSGNTAAEIQKVDPKFIQKAGIATSLTPGRNNGFLNMLKVMKQKAIELEEEAVAKNNDVASTLSGSDETTSSDDSTQQSVDSTDGGPMYQAIITALQQLQPTLLELKDVSYQHAGHAGAREMGKDEETHFELDIVAEAFDGLNLVKRHKLVYMMLGEVMPQIHALQIRAKTPSEMV